MHHTLEIPEILLDIFGYCRKGAETASSDLPALARTCRAFKEPALALLWGNLSDPSPIVRCLPEASNYIQISSRRGNKCYSFCRTLTQTERDILRSYTCRIQSLVDDGGYRDGLDWKSVGTFLNPPLVSPLLPNLLHLHVISGGRTTEVEHLLCMPFPSLTSLTIDAMYEEDLSIFQHPIESLSMLSPDIKKLFFSSKPDTMSSKFFTSRIFRWQNLQTMSCMNVALDADALAHLSCMSALTELICTVSAALADQVTYSYSPLLFSNVRVLTLHSDLLEYTSRLLSRTRLPAVRIFAATIGNRPSKMDVSSFLSALDTSGVADTVEKFRMDQVNFYEEDLKPILALKDLQPFTALSKLRHFTLNIQWNVDLSNSDLLTVTSAWPRLELLHINDHWAWGMPGGITPDGLVQLLRQCPSLRSISLVIDARHFTEVPPSLESVQLPPTLTIGILGSALEQESVPAIAAFFARIARRTSLFFGAPQTDWWAVIIRAHAMQMLEMISSNVLDPLNDEVSVNI